MKTLISTLFLAGSLVLGGCGDKEEVKEENNKNEIIGKVTRVVSLKQSSQLVYEIQSKDKKIFANLIPESYIWRGDSIQILNYSIIDDRGIDYWKQEFNQGELKNAMYINIEKYKLPNKKNIIEQMEEDLGITSKK